MQSATRSAPRSSWWCTSGGCRMGHARSRPWPRSCDARGRSGCASSTWMALAHWCGPGMGGWRNGSDEPAARAPHPCSIRDAATWLMEPGALAFVAAAALACAVVDLASAVGPRITGVGQGLGFRSVTNAFARAGNEGLDPGAPERRRLLASGSVGAFAAGWFVFGLAGAIAGAAVAPAIAGRMLRARRARYRAAVEAGAGEIAVALADALSGGHSLRGAVISAAGSLPGAPGHELRRVAAELELGAATDAAMDAMRARIASPSIDVIVAG